MNCKKWHLYTRQQSEGQRVHSWWIHRWPINTFETPLWNHSLWKAFLHFFSDVINSYVFKVSFILKQKLVTLFLKMFYFLNPYHIALFSLIHWLGLFYAPWMPIEFHTCSTISFIILWQSNAFFSPNWVRFFLLSHC